MSGFEGAVGVDLVDCLTTEKRWRKDITGTGGSVAMLNPPHLGELLRESMDEVAGHPSKVPFWLVCERGSLSRLLNGKSRQSTNVLLALEILGWKPADHWMAKVATNVSVLRSPRARRRDAGTSLLAL